MQSLKAALLSLEDAEEISPLLCADLQEAVAISYNRISAGMNRDHPWRWNKLSDAARDARLIANMAIAAGASEKVSDALELASFSADLGRLILDERWRLEGEKPNQIEHGAESAEFLRSRLDRMFPKNYSPPELLRAVLEAVRTHSWIQNPTLEDVVGDQYAWTMANILRDIDMYGNWSKGSDYLTEAKMRQEKSRWGFTDGQYIPEEQVDRFLNSQPLVREECETYAGYMLQFLGWGFNFTYKELWHEVVQTGNPRKVLQFIGDSLMKGGHQETWNKIRNHADHTLGVTVG